MMGFDSDMMSGGAGGGFMFFGWLTYSLVLILIVLSIVALWKYIDKK